MFVFGGIAIPITMFALVSYAKNVPFITKNSGQNVEPAVSVPNDNTVGEKSSITEVGPSEPTVSASVETETAVKSEPVSIPAVVQTQVPTVQTSQITTPKPPVVQTVNPIIPPRPRGDDNEFEDD